MPFGRTVMLVFFLQDSEPLWHGTFAKPEGHFTKAYLRNAETSNLQAEILNGFSWEEKASPQKGQGSPVHAWNGCHLSFWFFPLFYSMFRFKIGHFPFKT